MMLLADEKIQGFLQLTSGLTRCRCECCGVSGVDEVTHLLVAEAVLIGLREHRAKLDRDQEAWSEAERAVKAAQAG